MNIKKEIKNVIDDYEHITSDEIANFVGYFTLIVTISAMIGMLVSIFLGI